MKLNRRAATAAIALSLALSLPAAEAKKEAAVPVGPPQPRIVSPYRPPALPPRDADPSWLLYRSGLGLMKEKRFGEALGSFRKAVDARASLYRRASEDLAAAAATKEAARAKDSISALVGLLAARDLISSDYEAIRERSGGSLVAEMGLLRERSPSGPLRGLIDAALLVVEARGLSRIGDSLAALARTASELERYPEAEFCIGKIYLAEGEARLAELQILRALEMSGSLELGDERYEMLEALSGVYKSQGDLKDYELRLLEIAGSSDLFAAKDEYYRNAMERTLAGQGIDKFMALYRIPDTFAAEAYSALGAYYLESGRPKAVIYLAAAVNLKLSKAIGAIKVDYPSYAYKGLPELLARILAEGELESYAEDSGLWGDLVRLGEALAATGNRETARELWTAVRGARGAPEPWGRRAAAALAGAR
jgi:hypothetical protein